MVAQALFSGLLTVQSQIFGFKMNFHELLVFDVNYGPLNRD